MTLRALVTRPEEDAAPLAAALAERGVEVSVEPLLTIRPIPDAPIDLREVQALLFTSANGVRSLAALAAERNLPGWRDLPAFAVGDASAAAARAAGFARVESAGADVTALARLVIDRLDPKAGPLFHAAGSAVAGDLAGMLTEAGFTLRREMLYAAKPAEQLSPATVTALANGDFDLALFFSPRTAATFATLARAAGDGVVNGCAAAAAVCLSPAVAAAARELPWREVRVAARPELPALLELIDRELAGRVRSVGSDRNQEERSANEAAAASLESATVNDGAQSARGRRSPWWSVVVVAGAVSLAVALVDHAGFSVLTRSSVISIPDVATSGQVLELGSRLGDVATEVEALRRHVDDLKGDLVDSGNRIAALESTAQSAPTVAPDIAGLTQRLEKLEGDFETLRTTGQPSLAAPTADVAALTERIAALESRLAGLQTRPAPAGVAVDAAAIDELTAENARLRDDLAALTAQVGALDRALSARNQDAGAVAFVLAVGNLGSALATARPFAAELSVVAELAADDPALSAQLGELTALLMERADAGVPTLVELRGRFPAAARAIVDTGKQQEAPAVEQPEAREWYDTPLAWLSSAGAFLTSQVSVRPIGDVPGDDPGARVARTEVRLNENALAAAVAEMEGLTGPAAMAAAAWLGDARARLAADQAVAALQSAAVTRLGAPSPPIDAGG